MAELVIGLTGGIGSGKTAVSNMFAELGIDIIDADIIARQIVEPNQLAYLQIVEHFGQEILISADDDAKPAVIDRQKLREVIFNQPNEKTWLNNLLHPLIREEMLKQTHASQSQYCILAIPLLVENKLECLVNRVLVVDCDEETQLERVLQRDNSQKKTIQNIIAAQASRQQRLAKADDIIENNTDITELRSKIAKLHQFYLTIS